MTQHVQHTEQTQHSEHIVFVYGTLKRNFSNHHLLLYSKYLGTGKTVDTYSLYVSGIPYVIKHESISHIHGELYSVNDHTLARLDMLEGHPDWYRREEVKILVDNDQIVTAWLYFFPKPTGNIEASGRYELR